MARDPLSQDTSSELTYTPYEGLEPVQPEPSTYEGLLKSLDWKIQFCTLTVLRQVCKYHSEVYFQLIPGLLPLVIGLSDSIRSNLSKNALLLLTEMFIQPHPAQVLVAETLVPGLLQKTISEKAFIKQEAAAALQSLCRVAGNSAVLQQLGLFCWHKSGPICDNAFLYLKIAYETANAEDVFRSVAGLLNSKRKKIEAGAISTLKSLQTHPQFPTFLSSLDPLARAKADRVLLARPCASQGKDIKAFIEERKKALQENN